MATDGELLHNTVLFSDCVFCLPLPRLLFISQSAIHLRELLLIYCPNQILTRNGEKHNPLNFTPPHS